VTDTREHIEQRPLGRIGEPHTVGRDNRHMERRRHIHQHAVIGVFVAQQMALNLDVHIAAAEHTDERIDKAAHAIFLKPQQLAPRERDEAACLAVELVERERTFAFRRAHFHARDEPAEVSVPFSGLNQNRHSKG
jgi:hypothetical protein